MRSRRTASGTSTCRRARRGCGRRLSVPEMLGKLPRPDFAAEDIAHRVYGNAFGGAGALHLLRIGNAVEDFAGLELADADASEPAGVRGDAVGFGVGDVDEAVAQVDAARAAELVPLGDGAAG